MNVIVDFCVIPIGVGVSLSEYVALCQRILADTGLNVHMHANGTSVEGEWEAVFTAIKQCHEEIHAAGAPRIATTLRLGTRIDRSQAMADKIASVQSKI